MENDQHGFMLYGVPISRFPCALNKYIFYGCNSLLLDSLWCTYCHCLAANSALNNTWWIFPYELDMFHSWAWKAVDL